MGALKIQTTLQDFFNRIEEIKNQLENLEVEIQDREDRIYTTIQSLRNVPASAPTAQSGTNTWQEELQAAITKMSSGLAGWEKQINQLKKGKEFIHRLEKSMIVMVFGKVKVGKSTLGNFMAGQQFLEAPFTNPYQRIAKPFVQVEEMGRVDTRQKEWFDEGSTESTCVIQYFTLPGFAWVDTPGIGAVVRPEDKRSLEDLTKEYVNYADAIVFLTSSDAPGLSQDFDELAKLKTSEKPALLVITKSDDMDEDLDEEGNIIQKRVPKSPEKRQSQENYLRDALKEKGIIGGIVDKSISVSTYLAQEGIKEQNDEIFAASNMGEFYKVLSSFLGENAVALKMKNPRSNINKLIRNILEGFSGQEQTNILGLVQLEKEFEDILKNIVEKQEELVSLRSSIIARTLSDVDAALSEYFYQKRRELDIGAAKEISATEIEKKASEIFRQKLNPVLEQEVSALISDFTTHRLSKVAFKLESGIEKQYDTVEFEVKESYRARRSARNIFEKIGEAFGKEYYTVKTDTKTEYIRHETGTNADLVFNELMTNVKEVFHSYIQQELQTIDQNYFMPLKEYTESVLGQFNRIKQELEGLKYEMETLKY